ncbi:BTAD domain-containing putative transcriptional regulator [Nonomuraea dietziae]|uniref:BTAD domain-containing putative transcriptional regulator n=1 Tax=Nonomuraea dietziae TaxID=65515 RepID=UPI0036085F27
MVAFRVLGPVEAYESDSDDELDLGGLRQRAVLARLLVARGQVVPVDTLLYDLWDDDAAKGAQSGLQVYISRLRRVLEPGRPRGGPNRLLVTVASGYALRVAPDQVDALRFEQLVRAAGEHLEGDDPQSARARLGKALGLWRGTPYSDFADQPWAEAEVNRLTELRLVARERHADTGLRLGMPAETVPDLEALTTEHPLREEGWRLLALGLYRCGRQGDALAALRRARGILADELGIDPGPALRKLESDILAQSPELELAAAPRQSRPQQTVADTWPPRATTPVEPPPLEPEPFVGRDAELARLTTAAARTARFEVAIVTGDAGAGKTTLLRQLESRLTGDGWIASSGACPDSSATPPGWAWVEILRTLVGVTGAGEYGQLLAPLLDDADPDPDDDEVSGGFRLHRAVGGYIAGGTQVPRAPHARRPPLGRRPDPRPAEGAAEPAGHQQGAAGGDLPRQRARRQAVRRARRAGQARPRAGGPVGPRPEGGRRAGAGHLHARGGRGRGRVDRGAHQGQPVLRPRDRAAARRRGGRRRPRHRGRGGLAGAVGGARRAAQAHLPPARAGPADPPAGRRDRP